ncbi:hypothetical protein WCH_DA18570 [Waddlia chondrophila 2032/99]|uniref:Uncharacterized protein n=1 Tax=Waddlia chondrophila 2032/99 TaxID=765953 RepID=F8L9Z2_9BACT|nr:hypothetical protein WCH_DA18570 [Waddlia chondrophila 2032/99]
MWNWQRDIWKPIEGYGEKGNIFRSELERSFLRNCSVFCYFISQSFIFPSRSLSLRLFMWNWQRDIWKPIEGYGEKGNIFRSKLERSFLRNCSVFC